MLNFKMGSALCFIALLLQCTSPNPSDIQDTDTMALTVMSYNIHHANPPSEGDRIDIDAIAKVIKENAADLVALQEVDVYTGRSGSQLHQAKALADRLDMYFYFAKALDYDGGHYGNAVLSKFPIEDSLRIFLPTLSHISAEDRVFAGVKIKINGKDLWFGSVHLDYKSEENNLHQSQTLIQQLEHQSGLKIIAGDFNAEPHSETVRYFDQHFQRTCEAHCPPTIPVDQPKKAIDFIFHSKSDSLRLEEHRVVDEKYASDHLPVVAKINVLP